MFWFLIFLPALLALAHDIYLFCSTQFGTPDLGSIISTIIDSLSNPESKFHFSDLGYLWVTYSPGSYETVANFLSPDIWVHIQSILKIEAVLFGLLFAGFIITLRTILALFGIVPYIGQKRIRTFKDMNEFERMEYLGDKKRKFFNFKRFR